METTSPKRGFFNWKTLRIVLIVIVALATLLVALVTEENWRGRRDWEKYKAEQEAKGEHFDLDSFVPKLPPPDQNFAMTPFLAPLQDYKIVDGAVQWNNPDALTKIKSVSLEGAHDYSNEAPSPGNWRRSEFCDLSKWQAFYRSNTNFPSSPSQQTPARDVLFALSKFDPIFTELRAASERPYAVFPFHYDLELNTARFSECKRLVQLMSLHATAELEAGEGDEALKDIRVCLSLSKLLQKEPLLISQLVRIAVAELSIQPIWEGLARHRWTDEQLQELQKMLAEIQLLDDYSTVMRGERAYGNGQLEQYRAGHFPAELKIQAGPLSKFSSKAILYQNQIALNQLVKGFVLPAVDAAQHRVFPKRCDTNVIFSILSKPNPYNSIARMSAAAFAKVPERFARVQTSIDLATVATALERYHLAHREYPENLKSLSLQFAERLPNDVINGESLKYQRTKDGQFILYSVGWNEVDDSGQVVQKKDGSVDPDKGDWVWRYPTK
jgi:hypothetical protein